MERGGEGSRAALGREALAYARTLYNLARYLTGNQTDAEDLIQDTYTRALQGVAQFTPGTNLKAWLFRILRNTFISRYRRQRHNPTIGGLDTVDLTAQGPTREEWLRDDLELERLRNVVGAEIERALTTLSEEALTCDSPGSRKPDGSGGGADRRLRRWHGEVAARARAGGATAASQGLREIGGTMNCQEAQPRLLDYQRGRLFEPATLEEIQAHLEGCTACAREEAAEQARTKALEERLPQHAAPLALKRRLAAQWPMPSGPGRPGGVSGDAPWFRPSPSRSCS